MIHRAILTFLLSLLLVGMQQESQRHALEHVRPLLTRAHEVGVQVPVANFACAECALLAGGADAVSSVFDAPPSAGQNSGHQSFAYTPRAVAAPSYFQSRAPPVLL